MAFDYKKEYKEFYMPKNKPTIVDVPKMNYIAVRGKGDPNDEDGEYKQAIGLLYGIAYINYFQFLLNTFLPEFRRTARDLMHIADRKTGLLYHPIISLADSEFLRNTLQTIREKSIFAIQFFYVFIGHISEDNGVSDLRKFPFQLFQNRINHTSL